MAMAVLTMLPPAVLYVMAQQYFVEGVTTTGIKG
jgi:ABC-type maltose transport system permease subunit